MDELLVDFLSESAENLESIGTDLVRWEKTPGDRALLDRVFRVVHTIKGTCGFLDLPRLGRLVHAAEGPLAKARDGATVPDSRFISTILAAFDAIQTQLAALGADGSEPRGSDDALIAALEAIGRDAGVIERSGIDRRAALPMGAQPATVVRVGVALLDELMESVSELVLARDALLQLDAMDDAARTRAVEDSRPTVLEVECYRFRGFTVADAMTCRYRTQEEVEWQREHRDPIQCWGAALRAEGLLDDAQEAEIIAAAKAEARAASDFALASPWPERGDICRHVYWEVDHGTPAGRHFFGQD